MAFLVRKKLDEFLRLLPRTESNPFEKRLRKGGDPQATVAAVQRFMSGRSVIICCDFDDIGKWINVYGYRGIILDSPVEEGAFEVQILLPRLRTKIVRVPLLNLSPILEEPFVTVLYALPTYYDKNKHPSELKQKATVALEAAEGSQDWISVKKVKIFRFVSDYESKGFVQLPTKMCAAFGLHIVCFAKQDASSGEDNGVYNVAGTFLTSEVSTGQAKTTVVGPCVMVRLSPGTGHPVDFTYREGIRALHFVSDLLSLHRENEVESRSKQFLETIIKCYPFYDIGSTMRLDGFDGTRQMKRQEHGFFDYGPSGPARVADHVT